VEGIVLRDRKQLSEDGMLVIVLTLSKSDGSIILEPDTTSRGFVYARESEDLLNKVNEVVKATISELQGENKQQLFVLRREIKKAVGQYLFSQTKRKPMILPIIIEV